MRERHRRAWLVSQSAGVGNIELSTDEVRTVGRDHEGLDAGEMTGLDDAQISRRQLQLSVDSSACLLTVELVGSCRTRIKSVHGEKPRRFLAKGQNYTLHAGDVLELVAMRKEHALAELQPHIVGAWVAAPAMSQERSGLGVATLGGWWVVGGG